MEISFIFIFVILCFFCAVRAAEGNKNAMHSNEVLPVIQYGILTIEANLQNEVQVCSSIENSKTDAPRLAQQSTLDLVQIREIILHIEGDLRTAERKLELAAEPASKAEKELQKAKEMAPNVEEDKMDEARELVKNIEAPKKAAENEWTHVMESFKETKNEQEQLEAVIEIAKQYEFEARSGAEKVSQANDDRAIQECLRINEASKKIQKILTSLYDTRVKASKVETAANDALNKAKDAFIRGVLNVDRLKILVQREEERKERKRAREAARRAKENNETKNGSQHNSGDSFPIDDTHNTSSIHISDNSPVPVAWMHFAGLLIFSGMMVDLFFVGFLMP